MEDDAGGVDDAAELRSAIRFELFADRLENQGRIDPAEGFLIRQTIAKLLPELLERVANREGQRLPSEFFAERRGGLLQEEFIDGRNFPQEVLRLHTSILRASG